MSWIKNSLLCGSLVLSSGCYYVGLAKGQLEVMYNQRPLEEVIQSTDDGKLKYLLGEVPNIKRFAEEVVLLGKSDNYSDYYHTDREGMTFVVTASEKFELETYTWCVPFLGDLPYKGFFNEEDALELESDLKEECYDTYIFKSTAYSTLGWFDDPVTPFMVDGSLYKLTNTIIHELTHSKVFISGDIDFNEELASFVGHKGAEKYFRSRGIFSSELEDMLNKRNEDIREFKYLIYAAKSKLEIIYDSEKSKEYMLAARQRVFDSLSQRTLELFPDSKRGFVYNNARILTESRYGSDSDEIKALWEESGEDWKTFWQLVDDYVNAKF